jgi:hypothetical protein
MEDDYEYEYGEHDDEFDNEHAGYLEIKNLLAHANQPENRDKGSVHITNHCPDEYACWFSVSYQGLRSAIEGEQIYNNQYVALTKEDCYAIADKLLEIAENCD